MEASTYAIRIPGEILAAVRALARGRGQLEVQRVGTRFIVEASRMSSGEANRCPRVIIYDPVADTTTSVWLIGEAVEVAIISSEGGVPSDKDRGIVSVQSSSRQKLSEVAVIRLLTAALKQWSL